MWICHYKCTIIRIFHGLTIIITGISCFWQQINETYRPISDKTLYLLLKTLRPLLTTVSTLSQTYNSNVAALGPCAAKHTQHRTRWTTDKQTQKVFKSVCQSHCLPSSVPSGCKSPTDFIVFLLHVLSLCFTSKSFHLCCISLLHMFFS